MRLRALFPIVFATACGGTDADEPPLPIELAGSLQNPCWSPDSTQLLVTAYAGGYSAGTSAMARVPAGGGAATVLMDAANNANPPVCWNAMTNAIVFLSDAGPAHEVWWMKGDGTGRKRVTNRPGTVALAPSMSPDGKTIVFESHVDGDPGSGSIWRVGTDGMGLTQLTTGSDDRRPVWSPSGDRILFQSSSNGDWDLWTMTPTGDDLRSLTGPPSNETDPAWSPDGARIVFASDREELPLPALFVIPAGGGNPLRVTDRAGYEGAPSWSPDGLHIAFESSDGAPAGSTGTAIRVAAPPPPP